MSECLGCKDFDGDQPTDLADRASLRLRLRASRITIVRRGCVQLGGSWPGGQQGATQRQLLLAFAIGQKAEVDPHQAGGEHVEQKPSYELDRL